MLCTLDDTPSALVPFTAARILSGGTLWLSADWRAPRAEGGGRTENILPEPLRHEHFHARFAYAIEATPCLAKLRFGPQRRILFAERYGGRGLGNNGGGARVGTMGRYQLKGVGTNCLAGAGTHDSHRYGGLDAQLATNEAIMSNALCRVLPHGCAQVVGLIHTGAQTAFTYDGDPCLGAIMVRESSTRPAHYLPAPGFTLGPGERPGLATDRERVRSVLHELRAALGGTHEHFWRFMTHFLERSAHQFGCARANRLTHGALSASNLCMDGRWLDAPMSGFVPGGKNYFQSSYFYAEKDFPVEAVFELVHTYNKVHGVSLNAAPLSDHYARSFAESFSFYLADIFGLCRTEAPALLKSQHWRRLTVWTERLITKTRNVDAVRPEPSEEEIVALFLEGIFLSYFGVAKGTDLVRRAFSGLEAPSDELCAALRVVLDQLGPGEPPRARTSRALRCMLIACKRAHMCRYFYLSPLDAESSRLCSAGHPRHIAGYIESSLKVAEWVFTEKTPGETVVFRSERLSIHFASTSGRFCIRTLPDSRAALAGRDQELWVGSLSDALPVLVAQPREVFRLHHFDAYPYVRRLIDVTGEIRMPSPALALHGVEVAAQ